MRLRTVLGVVPLVLLGLGASLAAQQQASVRLDYQRKEGAGACPDPGAVASSVAERLGYEPFDAAAPDTVKVTISGKDRGLQARIEMLGANGRSRAERVLGSRRSDCADLAATMALAIAIAIDPFSANARGPTTVPAPAPPRENERETVPSIIVAPPETSASPPRGAPTPRPIAARAALGLVGGIGSAPVRNLGVTVSAGARRAYLSIDLEGRADLPASVPLQVGEVSTSLLVASLVPCVHWSIVSGCALLTAGALRAAGHGLVESRQVVDPFVAVGARVALEMPIVGQLYLVAHGDASAPLITTELRVGGDELWTTPPISGLLGLGLGFVFP